MQRLDRSVLPEEFEEHLIQVLPRAQRVLRRVWDIDARDDLLATALCRAWARRSSWNPELPFEPWFMAILTNLLCDYAKEVAMKPTPIANEVLITALDSAPEPPTGPEQGYSEGVERALATLTQGQRTILLLGAAGYGASEMGQLTGRSANAASVAYHRARQAFIHSLRALTMAAIAPAIRVGPRAQAWGSRLAHHARLILVSGHHIHLLHLLIRP